jgi:hypothetical protein
MADDSFGWTLEPDGRWQRRRGRNRAAHRELMERTLAQVQSAAQLAQTASA